LLFSAAAVVHRREGSIRFITTLAGLSGTVVSLTVFLSLQWKDLSYGGAKLLTGGALGAWMSNALLQQLNSLGSTLVALLILCLALAISTPLNIPQAGARLIEGLFRWSVRATKYSWLHTFRIVRLLVVNSIDAVKNITSNMAQFFYRNSLRLIKEIANKPWIVRASDQPPIAVAQISDDFSHPSSHASSHASSHLSSSHLSKPARRQSMHAVEELSMDAAEEQSLDEAEMEDTESGIKILPRETTAVSSAQRTTPRTITRPRRGNWSLPTVEFLRRPPIVESSVDRSKLIANSQILKQKFADFGIDGEVTAVRPGPVITLYEFKPGPGVKVSRIAALADDLSMALSAQSVRILAPLPGKSVVGIEIPSEVRETVYLREFLQDPDFYGSKHSIPVVMGKDIGGQTYLSDLARMPHLLCAGQTGSGKSVFMNGLICSLFYRFTPDELRMILVDPKFIEFRAYQDMPHLLLPVVDDPKQASIALKWAVREMERRYRILAKMGSRNLAAFNQKIEDMGADVVRDLLFAQDTQGESSTVPASGGGDWIEAFEPDENGACRVSKLPYIVIIIDELADLMMTAKKEVEISIARIAQKARAAGIHLIIATQRPSTDVITGLIKANLPSRVSFQLASYVDSKTILDRAGAERLLGQGDMLFVPPGVSTTLRLHGAFLEDEEISKITSFLKAQGKPVYRDEILLADDEETSDKDKDENGDDDELFREAMELVKTKGHASASYLQRHFKVGYNRAARMIETMEARGIIGPQDGARPREILIRCKFWQNNDVFNNFSFIV
jgi:DNA segregation ATPase FtsK/SpoIIIE-like protein